MYVYSSHKLIDIYNSASLIKLPWLLDSLVCNSLVLRKAGGNHSVARGIQAKAENRGITNESVDVD